MAAEVTRTVGRDIGRPATREEIWHGKLVADPYAFLEGNPYHDSAYAEMIHGRIEAVNAQSRPYLDSLPRRDEILGGLQTLYKTGSFSIPEAAGNYTFQWRRESLESEPILYMKDNTAGNEVAILYPNKLQLNDKPGPVNIDALEISPNGRYVAYTASANWSEKSTLFVLDTQTGKPLGDVIPHTAECDISWLPDESGFYYTRHEQVQGEEEYHRNIYFHAMGADWREDPIVFKATPQELGQLVKPQVAGKNGEYLLVTVQHGESADNMELIIARRDEIGKRENPFVNVFASPQTTDGRQRFFSPSIVQDPDGKEWVYFKTSEEAPNYRVVRLALTFAADMTDPKTWQEVIPPTQDVLVSSMPVGDKKFLLHYYHEARESRLVLFDTASNTSTPIALPDGLVIQEGGLAPTGEKGVFSVMAGNYTTPTTLFTLDTREASPTVTEKQSLDIPGEFLKDVVAERVTFPSKDGTDVSMFIIRGKDAPQDGSNKTILTGYGGYGIATMPKFDRNALEWVKLGGVYAVAQVRGGGENGEDMHRDAMRDKKQNNFDDMIAAAEYLQKKHWTTPEHMALYGRSNGAMVALSVAMQRPDLFAAVVPQAPFVDMLHFPKGFTGEQQTAEFGDPRDPKMFEYLYAYSPYHKPIKRRVRYPAFFLMGGEYDRRTPAYEVLKMYERLTHEIPDRSGILTRRRLRRPILAQINPHGGHEPLAQKPWDTMLAEITDIYSFLLANLN